MIFTPYSYYSLLQPTSHYWFGPKRVCLNHKTRVCLCATHREAQSVAGWSCRFLPTPSDSATTLMPASDSCCCGPMPDSISSWGLATVPLHSSSSPPGASSAAVTGGRQDTTHMGQLAAGIVWLRPVCLSSHGYSVHHTHKAWADCDGVSKPSLCSSTGDERIQCHTDCVLRLAYNFMLYASAAERG